jgi:hypothetical protein
VSGGSTFGLGDINHSIYFSPADSGPVIWGIGPSLTIPTATDKKIGTQKWSAGPAAVALAQPVPWVTGSLVRQLWSFAGDGDRQDVSQLLIQPFVNYKMEDGADHHGELGGGQRRPLDRAGRRRLRQDLQDRQPAAECTAPGLLQRRAPAVRPRVDHALPAPVPVPEVANRSQDKQQGRTTMRYSIASLGAATVIWAAASLPCTTALQSTAQAGPVPLESATLQGDEVIQAPIGEIELVDNYPSKLYAAARKLSTFLISRAAIVPVAAAALLPLVSAGATQLPIKELLKIARGFLLL